MKTAFHRNKAQAFRRVAGLRRPAAGFPQFSHQLDPSKPPTQAESEHFAPAPDRSG